MPECLGVRVTESERYVSTSNPVGELGRQARPLLLPEKVRLAHL